MKKILTTELYSLVKTISLNHSIVEDDVEGIVSEFFGMVRDEMKSDEFHKILIHNFGSFVPNSKAISCKKKSIDALIEKGIVTDALLKKKEILDKNFNKQFKHKRCH